MANQHTTKKVKVIGTQQYINSNTGETEDFSVVSVEERDFNFHKVWMRNFIATLDIVGNQKTRLCFWIIDNLNKDNMLTYTYRQIADKTGMSLDTVRVTMKCLLEADFLRKHNQGCYIVNPDIVFKGSRTGRMNILTQYDQEKKTEPTKEDKIRNIKTTIATLQKELEFLENDGNVEVLSSDERVRETA